jgi:hypothetical protein
MLSPRQSAEVRLLRINSSVKLDAWSIHRMTGFDIADIELFLEAEPQSGGKAEPESLSKLHGRSIHPDELDYKKQWELRQAAKQDMKRRPPDRDPAEHRRIVEAVYGV